MIFSRYLNIVKGVFQKDLVLALSYKMRFLLSFLSIFIQVFAFYYLAVFFDVYGKNSVNDYGISDYFLFIIIGISISDMSYTVCNSISAQIEEYKRSGVLEEIVVINNNLLIIISSSIYPMLFGLIKFFVYIFFGYIFFDVTFQGMSSMINIIMVFIFLLLSLIGIGLIAASFSLLFYKGSIITTLHLAMASIFGGIYYPITVLPENLQILSNFIPIYPALELIRSNLLITDIAEEKAFFLLFLLLFLNIVYFSLGLLFMKISIYFSKINGNLLYY